jgi:DNA-directed RNA polymerase specialized sigma subunit
MTMKLGSAALAELSDDELVARFQGGDNDSLDVLLQRYRRFTRAKARGYFLIGADSDDIEQEGMIGLFKAVRDFRPDRQASFRASPSSASPGRSSPPSRRRPARSTSPSTPTCRCPAPAPARRTAAAPSRRSWRRKA